jgi:excisionase family DNA binding protein
MPRRDTTSDWMTTHQAARCLGLVPRTLYRLIDHGHLNAYRFGRVIRLRQVDVDDYITACRVQPGELRHLYPDGSPADDH